METASDQPVRLPLELADSRLTKLLNILLPVLTMSVTYASYTLIQKRELTAATGEVEADRLLTKVFSSIGVFEIVKGQFGMCVYLINGFVTAWVSLNRINDFLHTVSLFRVRTNGRARWWMNSRRRQRGRPRQRRSRRRNRV